MICYALEYSDQDGITIYEFTTLVDRLKWQAKAKGYAKSISEQEARLLSTAKIVRAVKL